MQLNLKLFGCMSTLLVLLSLLSGCHTVDGVGKDMQAGGREISKTASR